LKHVWLKHFGVAWDDLGWLVFVDENVTLKADALASFDAAIEAAPPETLVVYADHDTRVGDQLFPEFKGKLDIEFLLAKDYVTPICAVKASLFTESPEDRSSLYAVVLKAALEHGADVFVHVPEVLATLDGAASPEAAALNALQRQLVISEALGRKAHVVAHRQLAGNLVVRRRWQEVVEAPPKITVIIPTLGAGRMIQPCVNTLLQHTAYPNFEVLVVVNGARDEPELGAAANDPRVTVARWKGEDGFNWSALNNSISGATTGDFLLFLNDDINVASMERDWLDLMMGHAVLEDVGAVGARLIHPAGFVQHVGVVVHNGIAAHLHMGLPNGHPGSDGKALLTHEASAVTGAAMLVSRKKFNEVGGFDEAFPLDYNDVDFCMKLRQRGYRNVVEMGAELMHSAAATRGAVATAESFQDAALRLAQRWAAPDPYWSPNLALGLAPNGMIQGLNCDILAWEDLKAAPTAQRVLIINDARGADSHALAEMRLGHIPFMADVSGFGMALIAPSPLNMGLWDIRKPADIEASLKALGIEQIVLRSLVGVGGAAPPVELLKCLAAVRMPTQVIPVSNELVAPWLDPNWDASTSPFGHSDVASWRAALSEFWPYLKMEEAAE
jgi:GT2 family glycosyltransferase